MKRCTRYAARLSVIGLLFLLSPVVLAQQADPVAESLGLTPEKQSLPIWANAELRDRQNLATFTRGSSRAVMIIGHPRGGHGTGFVISRKHRLVATNAHVADILHSAGSMLAITNGTAQVYKVVKHWYHPGIRRRLASDPSISIRSTDPREGGIDPLSPDLAVLQLAAEGPDLPQELTFATPGELDTLFSQPVAMMGYPGHDSSWPVIGDQAQATYHVGVVSRLTNFRLKSSVEDQDKQLVQYTMATWGGFSGSPVYLPNGHVVAVHNMARYARGRVGNIQSIPHGVRIDCLWELLAHHGLDDKVPIGIDKSQLRIARWLQPNPRDVNYRKAVNLVAEAGYLIDAQNKFVEGVTKCSQAIDLAPDYAPAYQTRFTGYLNYVFRNHRTIARSTSLTQLSYARADARKYIKLSPSDPMGFMNYGTSLNNTAYLTKNQQYLQESLRIANRFLTSDNLNNALRARAYSLRAVAYSNLRQDAQSLRDHNEALRLNPSDPSLWETRGDYYQNLGQIDRANSDKRRARQLRDQLKRR